MTIKGLQYFPLDVNFFENDKIAVVINDYGLEAAAVVLKLFAQIYKNGFYMKWNEKTCKVFTASFRSRFNSRQINQVIQTLTSEFVFEPKMFEKYQILTSKRIQTCFFAAASRRKTVEIEHPEYLLIDISKKSSTAQNVGLNRENACKNGKNVDIFEQRKEKERKENNMSERVRVRTQAMEQWEAWNQELLSVFGLDGGNRLCADVKRLPAQVSLLAARLWRKTLENGQKRGLAHRGTEPRRRGIVGDGAANMVERRMCLNVFIW